MKSNHYLNGSVESVRPDAETQLFGDAAFSILKTVRDIQIRVIEQGEEIDGLRKLLSVGSSRTNEISSTAIERRRLTPKEFSEALAAHGPPHRQMVPDTVRGNCKNKRLNCIKSGWSGKHQLWLLPIEEVQRYIDEGLLPPENGYQHPR